MTRWRKVGVRTLALIVMAIGLYLSRATIYRTAAAALDVSEKPRPADSVYILGGGSDDRPCVAAALFRVGLVKHVIQPSVGESVDDAATKDDIRPPETQLTRQVLIARGVPPEKIITLPGVVHSTSDEATVFSRYMTNHPKETVAIVTTAFHTRRVRLLFRRALGADAERIFFVAAPSSRFTADDWWQSEDGFVVYTTEYLKLALARGW